MPNPGRVDLAELSHFAVDAAWAAGRATLAHFQTGVEVERKGDGTPVTRADREAEAFLRQAIRERFPDDGLLGEEYGDDEGTSGRTWILDPIDGTKSFIHGVPLYAVLVAVAIEGRAEVGVIHLPGLNETVHAYRGGGCWWNGRQARVSAVDRLDEALITTSDFPSHEQPASVDALYRACRLRRTWGDAYGYALVATGRAEIMVDPVCAAWDVAPMGPILEEAGGRFSDLEGRSRFDGGNAAATNGKLHQAVLELVGR